MANRATPLAVAMGWRQGPNGVWYRENHPEDSTWNDLIFDPENKASDCESVINWLTEQGWEVEIQFHTYDEELRNELIHTGFTGEFGVDIHIWNVETEQHERTHCSFSVWKRCLCSLAAIAARRHRQT